MRNEREVWQAHDLVRLVMVFLLFLSAASTAKAQQTTGAPCSSSATTTIDGKYVPSPAPDFGGVINLSAADSKPCWPPKIGLRAHRTCC
jgi:hypothetical protein